MAPPHPPSIGVEYADALTRASEVLVLKFAQQRFGLDLAVLDRMGPKALRRLPGPGAVAVFAHPDGLASGALVLLGVPDSYLFGYRDVREFGRRAVEAVAGALPGVRELCLTLHGAGFGLDEREAFRAEVAGLVEAFAALPAHSRLETVTFLEHDQRRARRLRAELGELRIGDRSPAQLRAAGVDSDSRPHAFVAMPFGAAHDDVFHYGIVRPVERAGLLCERMDRTSFTGDIVEMMKKRIRGARVVVADLSGANPNVYLEVGFAWAAGVPTVLLCDRDTEPHFDVRGHRYLRYRSIRDAETQLGDELGALLGAAPSSR